MHQRLKPKVRQLLFSILTFFALSVGSVSAFDKQETLASSNAMPSLKLESLKKPKQLKKKVPKKKKSIKLSPLHRTGAVAAALGPGIFIHGLGHVVAGRFKTGGILFATEMIGLGLFAGAAVVNAKTGAARSLAFPYVSTMLLGSYLLMFSWLPDVYGVLATGDNFPKLMKELPWLQLEGGYRYALAPGFSYSHLAMFQADWRWKGLRFAPTAWVALDDDNQRLEMELGWSFVGLRPNYSQKKHLEKEKKSAPLHRLELEFITTYHRFGSDGFQSFTFGLALKGRLDLLALDPLLKYSFAEIRLGFGGQFFQLNDSIGTADFNALMLAKFGFGFYILGLHSGSEIFMFYQHRDDDFAGIKTDSIVNGVNLGHFGIDALLFVRSNWGFRFNVQIASVYFGGISYVYRFGKIK